MRAVEIVKDKRNQLRDELVAFIDAKNAKYPVPTNYKDLGEYEKQEFSYLMSCIHSLRVQINALEFILNEDTEIMDYTTINSHQREYGISKESVLKL